MLRRLVNSWLFIHNFQVIDWWVICNITEHISSINLLQLLLTTYLWFLPLKLHSLLLLSLQSDANSSILNCSAESALYLLQVINLDDLQRAGQGLRSPDAVKYGGVGVLMLEKRLIAAWLIWGEKDVLICIHSIIYSHLDIVSALTPWHLSDMMVKSCFRLTPSFLTSLV